MIYFDSAATTFQKPRTVADAMRDAMATMSSPGRGGYPAAMRAAEAAFDCRTELAELYHLENPEQVAFTMNATHGLNIAIKSLVPPGGKAVISGYEHNAVTRPLAALGAQPVEFMTTGAAFWVLIGTYLWKNSGYDTCPTYSASSSRWRLSPLSAGSGRYPSSSTRPSPPGC